MHCDCPSKAKLRRLGWALLWLGIAVVGANGLTPRPAPAADETPAALSAAPVTAEAPPAAEENPNPLQFKADLAIWTLAVFVVLFFVLKKFAWGPISEALDRREHHIAENIEAAKRTHEDAKQLLVQYEKQLAGAADQVRAMLDEARHDAENTKQQIVAEAKSAAQAEHQRAIHDIRTATDAAVSELSQRSADLAVELAGKIISAKITPEERSRMLQDSLTKFAAATPSRN
jgi:F-type H+-transporting ATPase subunit b